jgi:hypothetical protein
VADELIFNLILGPRQEEFLLKLVFLNKKLFREMGSVDASPNSTPSDILLPALLIINSKTYPRNDKNSSNTKVTELTLS